MLALHLKPNSAHAAPLALVSPKTIPLPPSFHPNVPCLSPPAAFASIFLIFGADLKQPRCLCQQLFQSGVST